MNFKLRSISVFFLSIALCGLGSHPSIAAPKSTFGNGTFTVGRDIQPGIYRTKSVLPSGTNWFFTISTTGSNGNEIIAIDNVKGGIPTLNLRKGWDIENSNCGTYVKSSLTKSRGTPRTSITDGIWLVGVDLKPGTYSATKDVFGSKCWLTIFQAGSNGKETLAIDSYTRGKPSVILAVGQEIQSWGCGTLKLVK